MGESLHTVAALPTTRQPGCPFDPPAELVEARRHGPISRCHFPGGKSGWLVTGYDLVRSVLADPRFSSRKELMLDPYADLGDLVVPPSPPGEFVLMDAPQHGRYRKPLVGKFTARRMRQLAERVDQVTADQLDAMEKAESPVDLVAVFAKPIPLIMICELLGVPYEDRSRFQKNVNSFMDGEVFDEELSAAHAAVRDYVAELVAAKREHPTDDILSELTASDLSDEELYGMGVNLLVGGYDTTASTLSLGTFALLRNPAQLAALRADPALVEPAVEELLRYLTVGSSFQRTALEDARVGGQDIRAGETVILSFHLANRDTGYFSDPDGLDLSRREAAHLTFGHGIHRCLGQQLARIELQTAFRGLLERFPTLRLAVPAEEIEVRSETAGIFGVKRLPVVWGD